MFELFFAGEANIFGNFFVVILFDLSLPFSCLLTTVRKYLFLYFLYDPVFGNRDSALGLESITLGKLYRLKASIISPLHVLVPSSFSDVNL